MLSNPSANLRQLEAELWDTADNLRANSKLTSGEYCMPVLGIIFLRHATTRYRAALAEIETDQEAGKMPKRRLTAADFRARNALMLPDEAQFDYLLELPSDADLGNALVEAMDAIEDSFGSLRGQLPREYPRFEPELLEELMRVFASDTLSHASGDVFGRINEYFLMKFALQGAQDNGEFFTPPSLVQTLVNVIEPDHGTVFDPACGSGGMFVQSSHFLEDRGENTAHKVTFYGHEYKTSNIRLALMNLAVHGLEGDIVEANTFYEDPHELRGQCDFVMANPPFNVDKIDAEKVKDDLRLPFGLPGINKDKKISNGNYLWISYFHSYLNDTGRAGFVMSSQASSAGNAEAQVRRRLVETGDVDVMISIRGGFFYTRTVPCELWHFDRAKPEERKDQILMLDARAIGQLMEGSRKVYEFTPEQQQNLTAIIWLYRGERPRYQTLLESYRQRLHQLHPDINRELRPAVFNQALELSHQITTEDPMERLRFMEFVFFHQAIAQARAEKTNPPGDSEQQIDDEAVLAKEGQQQLRELRRLIQPLIAPATKTIKDVKSKKAFRARAKQLEDSISKLDATYSHCRYLTRQYRWLTSRFPAGKFQAIPGLCAVVTRAEVEAADWSLTPGRYVGVAPFEEDADFNYEQTMIEIHSELAELDQRAAELGAKIQQNWEGMRV